MRNATHELVGVTLAVVAGHALHTGPVESAGVAAAAFCGARLPDIDQIGARVHRRTRLERRSLILGGAGSVLRLPLVLFGAVVPHRTLTHSALACGAVAVVAMLIAAPAGTAAAFVVGGGVAVGYAAHVVADACTPGGVRLWAPFSQRQVWLLPSRARIPTGSWREAVLAGVAAAALAVVLLA